MKRFVFALIALLICTGASANLGRFTPPDPRLDRKITLDVYHAKLDDVARSLTKQSGITIQAGTGQRDWKVREQHVTVQVKDVPLSAVLDQIAKLHTFCLSREGKENYWTYTIWQDKKGRDLEEEMLTADKEARAKHAEELCLASLELAKKAAGMTQDEAKKLREQDPMLAYLGGTTPGRGYAQLMASLNSTDLELMLRGIPVTIPFQSLSPALQRAAMDTTLGGIRAAERAQNPGSPQVEPLQLVIKPMTEDDGGDPAAMGAGGAIALMGIPSGGGEVPYHGAWGIGDPMSVFMLAKPGSMAGRAFANALFILEDGGNPKQFGQAYGKAMDEAAIAESSAHESPMEKSPPTDPALVRKVELGRLPNADRSADDDKLSECDGLTAAEIAEACSYSVLLESFCGPRIPMVTYLKQGKQPLYRILIGLEKAGYIWKIEGSTLRIRPKDWATRRSYAIPEATLKRYATLLESQGVLTLDDVACAASELSDVQISRTLARRDADLGYALSCLTNGNSETRALLRLYATLSTGQKASLHSRQGLHFGELSGKQWDLVAGVINDRVGGLYITDGLICDVSLGDSTSSKKFEVTATTDDQKPHRFSIGIWIPDKDSMSGRMASRKKAEEQKKPGPMAPAK